MNNQDLQNLIAQVTQQVMSQVQSSPQMQPSSNEIPATRENVIKATKPQLNMKQVADLIQPSTPLAMDENTLVQLSEGSSVNKKNK